MILPLTSCQLVALIELFGAHSILIHYLIIGRGRIYVKPRFQAPLENVKLWCPGHMVLTDRV